MFRGDQRDSHADRQPENCQAKRVLVLAIAIQGQEPGSGIEIKKYQGTRYTDLEGDTEDCTLTATDTGGEQCSGYGALTPEPTAEQCNLR